jgi:hypothetical protein
VEPFLAGYLTLARDGVCFQGGLLVVTAEGDPVQFLYTEPASLGALNLTLLGHAADAYLVARVLAPSLLARCEGTLSLLLVESPAILARDLEAPCPAVVIAPAAVPHRAASWVHASRDGLPCWATAGRAEVAAARLQTLREGLAPAGIEEPFARLREVLAQLAGGA